MIEVFNNIIRNTPDFISFFIVIAIIWILIGWFYAEVLGREIHNFIVFTIMIIIVLLAMSIFVNKEIQILFFGSY